MEYCEGCENILDNYDPPGCLCISCVGLAEAKANLIAAAPELLEACQARVDEWHSNMRNFTRREPESLKLARAAIVKAKGKAPIINDESKALAI